MPAVRLPHAEYGMFVFVLTLVAALIGLKARDNGVAVLWPAAGVIAGFIAVSTGARRNAVVLASLLALSIGNLTQGRSVATSLVFMAGNIGQAFVLAIWLRALTNTPFHVDTLRRGCYFFAMTAAAVTVTGFFTAAGLRATGHASAPYLTVWWLWISSHGIGILSFTPAVIALHAIFSRPWKWEEVAEYLAVLAPLAVVSNLLIGWSEPSNDTSLVLVGSTLYAVLLWGALRGATNWLAIAQMVIATVVIWHAARGTGLFAGKIAVAQVFLLASAFCTLSLAAIVAERGTLSLARREAEEKLRAAHDTFRLLIENSPFGIYVVDADFHIIKISAGAQKVFEQVQPVIGRDLAEVLNILWPQPFASFAVAQFRHTLATGEPFHAPSTLERRADIGKTEAYDWKIERITMPDGRFGVVCHFYDLSERQRHDEHVQKLMHEVNHRSKNMLGVVQAIARRTAATRPHDFIDHFDRRIQALSANQNVLVNNAWKSVPLGELVRSQLKPFRDLLGERVQIVGSNVEITSSAAQTLGMALHELATNAVKYGSLSVETGSVEISWSVGTDAVSNQRFRMAWIERGGPTVTKPSANGFGYTVISSMIKSGLDCDVEIDFAPTGVVWRIDGPADRVLENKA